MPQIHQTAVVDPRAELAEDVVVREFSIVKHPVVIGAGTTIGPYALVHANVRLGVNNRLHAHVVLGDLPQDMTFDRDDTWVEIGAGNVFREGCTVHRATTDAHPTRIGSHGFFMGGAHIAHDCQVGDGVVLANHATLGGHVELGHHVTLGGMVVVHQFVRVGEYAMVAGYIAVRKDVLPFSLLGGSPVHHYRLNTIGLRRAGIVDGRYRALERAFRALRRSGMLEECEYTAEVGRLRNWLAVASRRGIYGFKRSACQPSASNPPTA